MSIQFKRSAAPGVAPTSANLKEGELGINLYNKKLYTLDQNKKIINIGFSQDYADAAYLKITGGVMKGRLQLYSGALPVSGTDGLDDVVSRRYIDMQFGTDDNQVRTNALLDGRFVQLTGSTMTGTLRINNSNPLFYLDSTNSSEDRTIFFNTNGLARWGVNANSAVEGGSNSGSNFEIRRYNDSGVYLDNSLTINRNTGVGYFTNTLEVGESTYNINSRQAASASTVFKSKGNRKFATLYTSSATVPYDQLGSVIELQNSNITAFTITLPSPSLSHTGTYSNGTVTDFTANGSEIVLWNNSAVSNVLYCGASAIQGPTVGSSNTVTLKPHSTYIITSDGSSWFITVETRTDAWWNANYSNLGSSPVFSGGITSSGFDSGGANFRAISGSYGVMLRNDGSSAYLMNTNSGSPSGSFNSLRPLSWNLANGTVTIDGSGAGTTMGGYLTVQQGADIVGDLTVNGVTHHTNTTYGTGFRANKGAPGSNTTYNGFAFQADGDTGMFAEGGDASSGSNLVFRNDLNNVLYFNSTTGYFASRPVFAGATPWDTGNFDPSSKATLGSAVNFGSITSTLSDGVSHFRAVQGSYGAFLRNDGANMYFLSTNANDQYGTWNTYRPFSWNLSSGSPSIGVNTPGTYLSSSETYVSGRLWAYAGVHAGRGSPAGDAGNCGYSFGGNGDTGMFAWNGSDVAGNSLVFLNDGQNIFHSNPGNLQLNVNTYYKGTLLENLFAASNGAHFISEVNLYIGNPTNATVITIYPPRYNNANFVLYRIVAWGEGYTDIRHYYVCSGNSISWDRFVASASSDDTDQGGTASLGIATTAVLPWSETQQFVVGLSIGWGTTVPTLKISIVGYG